jgi:hypothetical protein
MDLEIFLGIYWDIQNTKGVGYVNIKGGQGKGWFEPFKTS